MSTDAISSNDVSRLTPDTQPARGRWRTIVMVVVLVAFWAYILALPRMEMVMFFRFITRMGALLGLLLTTLVVWFSNSRFRWRDRFLVVLATIVLMAVVSRITDKSVDAFGLFLGGFPWIATGGAAWLWLASRKSYSVQRAGMYAIPIVVFGVLSLLRWEGLDGSQQSTYAWRWSPTSEQQFLAERVSVPASDAGAGQESAASDSIPDWTPQPGDWTSFRGGECEGVAAGLPKLDWTTSQPEPAWKQRIGPAWSSVLIVDGHLVTQEQHGESEAVVCYDAATKKVIWTHEEAGRFSEGLSGVGPRATPTYHDGRIYVVGAKGKLTCLTAKDGKPVWERDIIAEAGAEVPMWGMSNSPLAIDDLVVVFAGGGPKSLMAYRAGTGEPVWTAAGGKFSYGTPQALTIDGVRQIVMNDSRGLYSVNPADGKLLWEKVSGNENFQPMLQPHLIGGGDLIVEIDSGIARISVTRDGDRWSVAEKWQSNRLKPSFNDVFIHKGHIYGLDDGILCCVDLETGKRLWKKGRYGFGQILLLPEHDQLLVLSEKGEAVLVAASPDGHREQGQFSAIAGKTWNHPVIAHGRLYVRNAEEMACFLIAGESGKSDEQ